MAVTQAPLFSLDASGTVAGAIVFSKWKGRSYVRQHVSPSNPESGLQVAVRSYFRFLTQRYATLTAAQKAEWATIGDKTAITALDANVAYNQERIRRNLGAVRVPSELASTTPIAPTTPSATAATKSVVLAWSLGAYATGYALNVYRSTTIGFTADISNLKRTVPIATLTFTDIGLVTGTPYYYRLRFNDVNGSLGTLSAELTATPT